ncbi:MAG TPA: DUF3048 domain-containing protein [Acidimicrobiales bacterium]|nr:DUF3048 domain-containing protein [Acidimicrobiales bacterium]
MSDHRHSNRSGVKRARRATNASAGHSAASAATPVIYSLADIRSHGAHARKHQPLAIAYVVGATVVVLVGMVIALFTTSGSKAAAVRTSKVSVHTPATAAPPPVPTCPLSGTPAPGGTVPARPALGVKIGNYTGDRPSAGLDSADIVFEEPVEGAITRLVAVFQCQTPALVGDLRSARQPDAGILSQLSDPLFVHAGGIPPVLSLMSNSPLIDKDLYEGGNSSAIILQPGRMAPYSTFVNTASLWAFDPADVTPPAPIFQYSTGLPAGSTAGSGTSVHIPFSGTSDVTWTWNPAGGNYLRSYAGLPDTLLTGGQTTASNVVIMTVQTSSGSWVENEQGGHEVLVTTTGSGPVIIMRNGAAIAGTWSRTSLTTPATFTANGAPITLQPGNTWEELVPAGVTVTPSPG